MAEKTQEPKKDTKLPFEIEWGFGIANFIYQLFASIFMSYFTFIMTDVFMLGTSVAAAVKGTSSITGIVSIFLFAVLFQYVNPKGGRYRSWIYIFVPVIGITTVGMLFPFNLPRAVWGVVLVVFYVIYDLSSAGFGVVTRSLVTKCASDNQGRMLIIGRQNVLHNIARMVAGAIIIPIVTLIGGSQLSPKGWCGYFGIFAFLTLFAYLWLGKVVKPYDPYDTNFRQNKANKVGVGDMVKALISNPNLLVLFIGVLIKGMLTLSASIGAYFFTYVSGGLGYFALYNTLNPLGGVVGGLLSPWFSKRFDKKKLYIGSMAVKVYICLPVLAVQYFVTGHINPIFAIVMGTLGFLVDNLQRTYFSTFWMDCSEYSFWKTKKDVTPIVMTLANVPPKISAGVAAALGLAVLGWAGYHGGQQQAHTTLTWIVCLFTLAPAVAESIFFIIFGLGYKLDNKTLEKIMAENKETRAQLAAEAAAAKAAHAAGKA